MESPGSQHDEGCCGADRRSAWGLLAAAAVAGVMVAKGYPRGGVMIGLGLALWKCCGEKARGVERGVEVESVGKEVVEAKVEEDEAEEGQGGWLLNLEPVPLVVREDRLPVSGQGQGDDLLGQGPGQAVEEMDWVASEVGEALWMNEGAEIPDSVELPELGGEGPGASSTGQAGV